MYNKNQGESAVFSPDYTAKYNPFNLAQKNNLSQSIVKRDFDINAFMLRVKDFFRKGEFENILKMIGAKDPMIFEKYPKILLWIYKCWFLILKKFRRTTEAEQIFHNYLLPSYVKSEKMKSRINTFSVILHCQNVNSSEINYKIDKYSDKVLFLLQNILKKELNGLACGSVCQAQVDHDKKYIEILRKMELKDEDSCLSDIEDEIFKSCRNTNTNEHIIQKEKDIFKISKEKRVNENEVGLSLSRQISISEETRLPSCNYTEEVSSKTCDGGMYENIENFEKFSEEMQASHLFQPLNNINCSLETCADSRKISECFMDVDDEEILTYSVKDDEKLQNTNSFFSHNHTVVFKNSKISKIDPRTEPSSNLNMYRKSFYPKVSKSQEKLKNIVPFLREFNPKFLKKENIDKKILRKFRNFIKSTYKQDRDLILNFDSSFWRSFASFNLLPPMIYTDDKKMTIEFKSFNTKYMLWLFSKNGSVELYRDFATKSGEEILWCFINAYDLTNEKEEAIIDKLRHYIFAIPDIYSIKMSRSRDKSYKVNSNIKSEDLIDYYLGPELDLKNSFNLPNFQDTGYGRCGQIDHYRNINEDYMDYYSHHNFADSLNVSMESIQSIESN